MKQPVMITSCASCYDAFNLDDVSIDVLGLKECYFCGERFVTCKVSIYYMLAFVWEDSTALAVQVDGGVWWKITDDEGATWREYFIEPDNPWISDAVMNDLMKYDML